MALSVRSWTLRWVFPGVLLLLVAGVSTQTARADRGLMLGVTESRLRWDSGAAVAVARDLGLSAVRVRVDWAPGQTELTPADKADLDRMVPAAAGLRIVVTLMGTARGAPVDAAGRDDFCAYARDVLTRYPSVNDVVIWNEPNLSFFWQPQYDADGTSAAPAAYVELLARCWDVLHEARPGVNVIMTTAPSGNDNPNAVSNVSHAPGTFIRRMGTAYRASGRQRPLFDTVGHNPYGTSSGESPLRQHLFPSHVGLADLDRLVQALGEGFGGTAQPVPGRCDGVTNCPAVWYLEVGYQTIPEAATTTLYTGRENDARPVATTATAEPTQASQLALAVKLAYCQPYVGAFFNFLLWDEPDLARWQSGVLAPDGSRKASYDTLRALGDEVRRGAINCATMPGATLRPLGMLVDRIEWSELRKFSSFNDVWGFNVVARKRVTYRATVRRVGATATRHGRPALVATGTLVAGRPRYVALPPLRLGRGSYRIDLLLRRAGRPVLRERRLGPIFTVT